ncbi:cytoskeleton protein RodZ [Vibrio ostreae]|uniref:Cytoskeleton protein RodZ n=1 Tax=Vibrio ostreae TaxID=2841925 RepID=A0A975U7S8_9VIBR|nr:cytoskeleton protein RodZ [Vibrio ostreae]QXO16783.1 cytoskeleton protein RodZ [Vibrio ostreae]
MNTEQDNLTPSTPHVQPGTLLKQKREALGLTQKQVADRLRLRITIIQNLEDNNFKSDLVATFTRGYLRSYAKAVGLSESEIVDAFEAMEGLQPQEQTMQSFSKKTKRDKHDSRIMTITWIILLVIIGMSSLWWWQNNEQDTLKPDSAADAVSAVVESTVAGNSDEMQPDFATINGVDDEISAAQDSDAAEMVADTDMAEEPQPVADEQVASEQVASEQVVSEQAMPEESATTEQAVANLLTLNFTADCWIQVKDASGKTLSTGIKKAGQTLNLRGEKPLQVILGAPEGVSVTFASEPVDLSGYTSGKVARFTLP